MLTGRFGKSPPFPSDPKVRKVADKLASFVAKNGRQFEDVTRQKNPGDTPFKFLFDVSCLDYKYYDYRLSEEEKALGQSRDCVTSQNGVKRIIKADKDRKIRFCCVQSKAAEPYMEVCGVERKDVLRRFLFVESPGSYHQGSSAALRVLSHLPLPISALSSLMFVPTPLRDAVYDLVAKRRYDWFGKDDDCLVLKEVELLERFVDGEELLERIRSKQL
ncbi:hypothetical protein ACS0TY_019361 [Phlomoides rotata]